MPVLLMVDRSEPGPRNEPRISAMLWSADKDPWLLDAQQFRGETELRRWLGKIAAVVLGLACLASSAWTCFRRASGSGRCMFMYRGSGPGPTRRGGRPEAT